MTRWTNVVGGQGKVENKKLERCSADRIELHAAHGRRNCVRVGQGFFPSIQATLNHILIIDWFYVDALEGGTLGPAAWSNRIPCKTVADLWPAQAAVDRRLIVWCEALSEDGINQVIHVHRGTRVQTERADRLLLHLFQHQIHHRGQAHAMLSSTPVPPPQLDEFFSVAEAPLRAAEFGELGWTEATIWGAERPG